MTIEELKGYKQVRTPDVAALANCISRAKGSERTMAQFAADTGISASTLSRIVNMNIKKPLSTEMIIAIFVNRAEQADEYLLDSIARANGLASPDRVERMSDRNRMHERRFNEMNVVTMMKNAILGGVLAAGIPIAKVYEGRVMNSYEADQGLPMIYEGRSCDFFMALGENLSKIKVWRVYAFPYTLDEEDTRMRHPARMALHSVTRGIAPLFLRDAWDAESLSGTKTSFAFVDERIFAPFVEQMRCAKLNNEMTILLLDPTNGYKVIDEVWIPGTYNQLSNISVFSVPMPGSEADDFDDEDEFGKFEDTEDTE